MTKQEQLETVATLLKKLFELRQGKDVSMSIEENQTLEKVYKLIYPYVFVNMGCPSCVKQYLYNLEGWYEREWALYQKSIDTSIAPQAVPEKSNVKQHTGRKRKLSTGN